MNSSLNFKWGLGIGDWVLIPRHIDYIKADSTDSADVLILFSEEHHKAFMALRFGKSAAAETHNIDKHGSTAV